MAERRLRQTEVYKKGAWVLHMFRTVPAKPKEVKFNDFEGVLAEVKNEGWGS